MILGYRLIESYWNKGIASETAKACLSYAFNDLNLTEVYAICDVENIGSKNLLQKCGLTLIEDFYYDGALHHRFQLKKENLKYHIV